MLFYETTVIAQRSNKSNTNIAAMLKAVNNACATTRALQCFKHIVALTQIANNASCAKMRSNANDELAIAQRKHAFWQRQSNFCMRAYCKHTSKARSEAYVIAHAYMRAA